MSLSPRIYARLLELQQRREEVMALLADPEVIGNRQRFSQLSREYAESEALSSAFAQFQHVSQELIDAEGMANDGDPEMRAMAQEEIQDAKQRLAAIEDELLHLLLPRDPNDAANVFLEVRAGTGGEEAALFARDLFDMYTRYASKHGWKVELMSERFGDHGGYKEVITRIEGKDVYSRLKFESGTHRVQRVPQTEAQGRIHTSACTVAILPEVEAIESVDINPADLRIDTYRSSGAGGQHVNKTDSAIRITHLPTGLVVECQSERSQHQNRAHAMALLRAQLLTQAQDKQTAEQAQSRKLQVGSGDRSERIRTYNFPQGRVTDHRIGLTLHDLPDILAGDLDPVIEALLREDQADQLKRFGSEDNA